MSLCKDEELNVRTLSHTREAVQMWFTTAPI